MSKFQYNILFVFDWLAFLACFIYICFIYIFRIHIGLLFIYGSINHKPYFLLIKSYDIHTYIYTYIYREWFLCPSRKFFSPPNFDLGHLLIRMTQSYCFQKEKTKPPANDAGSRRVAMLATSGRWQPCQAACLPNSTTG